MSEEYQACACHICKSLCKNQPGWFAPDEARRAIEAGYAARMMRDWLEPCSQVGNEEKIYVLAAASEGHAGLDAPTWEEMCGDDGPLFGLLSFFTDTPPTKGPCVLQNAEGLCEIHDSGFKPIQCRSALGCNRLGKFVDNYEVAKLWDSDEGREVLELWDKTLRGSSEGLPGSPGVAT